MYILYICNKRNTDVRPSIYVSVLQLSNYYKLVSYSFHSLKIIVHTEKKTHSSNQLTDRPAEFWEQQHRTQTRLSCKNKTRSDVNKKFISIREIKILISYEPVEAAVNI